MASNAGISIHALLAESDTFRCDVAVADQLISIHALLAESDRQNRLSPNRKKDFYPRSPCGERPGLGVGLYLVTEISIHALLAESDNQLYINRTAETVVFLSTLSLRRATTIVLCIGKQCRDFYPRSPCGERPGINFIISDCVGISIHALLAESDL